MFTFGASDTRPEPETVGSGVNAVVTGLLSGYPGATTVPLEEGVRNPQDVWVPGGEREAEPRIEQGLIGSEVSLPGGARGEKAFFGSFRV